MNRPQLIALLKETLADKQCPTNTPEVVRAALRFLEDQGKCASFLEPIERAGMKAYVDLVYDHPAVKAGIAPQAQQWVTDAAISAVLTSIHRIAQARMPTVSLGKEELLMYDVHNHEEVAAAYRNGYEIEHYEPRAGRWIKTKGKTVGAWAHYFREGGKARAVKP